MKSTYKKADAEVVVFDNSDIVTISGGENNYYCKTGFDIPGSGCQDGLHDGRLQ